VRLNTIFNVAVFGAAFFTPQVFATGEVVDYIEAKNVTNPPPLVAFNTFDRFQVSPIDMVAPYAGQQTNEEVRKKLQADLNQRIEPILNEWNSAEPKNSPELTLKIEPTIRHVKYVPAAARVFGGVMGGGSGILMTVRFVNALTGEVVAEPEFYQHANKHAGRWSFGVTDGLMIVREADLIADYLRANYAAAVGGTTGKEDSAKN
jgi:hypothetical protein